MLLVLGVSQYISSLISHAQHSLRLFLSTAGFYKKVLPIQNCEPGAATPTPPEGLP